MFLDEFFFELFIEKSPRYNHGIGVNPIDDYKKEVVSQRLSRLIRYLFPRFSLFIPSSPSFLPGRCTPIFPCFPACVNRDSRRLAPGFLGTRLSSTIIATNRQVDGIATRKEKERRGRGRKRAFPSDNFILSTICLLSILRMRNNPPTVEFDRENETSADLFTDS